MASETHERRFEVDDEAGGTRADVAATVLPHDVAAQTLMMVNVVHVGEPGSREWVLVDAGLPGMADRIASFARDRFGDGPPRAIVLTHGHFDHVGSLRALLDRWPDVTVFAHRLELPYLTGRSAYPPPDPTVGGGIMPRLSPLFPTGPEDFGDRVRPLPDDGTIPEMPGWRWVATPGHSPGHVSFFRDDDRTLIAGDAFVTQRQESMIGALTHAFEFRGPPMYFTPDWTSAEASVRALADMRPERAVTGHGTAIAAPLLKRELDALAADFRARAVPRKGRYVDEPAIADETGVVSVPPKPTDPVPTIAIVAAVVVGGLAAFLLANRKQGEADRPAKTQSDVCE